ncbi:MAG: hypothetical protein H6658_17185 [Ardenticatenaceae bacterium]|nr:hypothetical protein [Ardenticatenaceae bacterium]
MKRTGFWLITSLLLLVIGLDGQTAVANTEGTHFTYLPFITYYNNLGPNQLPNSSFEGGWYHPNGIPELQIPNDWEFEWDEGPTGHGNEPWDVWVRPEVRVLPAEQLPPAEQPIFIWDGNQTLKIFKGWGAISFRLTTQVTLQPGTYLMAIRFFPDLVADYENGQKIFATDPYSGEVAFILDGIQTEWQLPAIGQRNQLVRQFTVTQAGTQEIGVAMRGRYALVNNGWFMDMWTLQEMIPED